MAVHIDDGFDTEISKKNLKKLIDTTGYDYKVVKPDKEQYYALTRAYMEAGVANLCAPQDSVLFAFLYEQMRKEKINCFVSGWNFAGECIMQGDEIHSAYDDRNIKEINKKFGTKPINKLKLLDYKRLYVYKKVFGFHTPTPLNYIKYDRETAFRELGEFCKFQYYGRKHLENILTAFVQLYWLPGKFGIDKRNSHYSSMIVSGQMTREQALKEMELSLYDEKMINEYIDIVKEKLCISDYDFSRLMKAPVRSHSEFKTNRDEWFYKIRHFRKHK